MSRKRLLWQLYPSYLGITLLCLFAVGWYASRFLRDFHQREAEADLVVRTQLAARLIQDELTDGSADSVRSVCRDIADKTGTRVLVVLAGGEVIGDSDEGRSLVNNYAELPEIKEALAGKQNAARRYSYSAQEEMNYAAAPIGDGEEIIGAIRMAAPVSSLNEAIEGMQARFVLAGALIVAIAACVTFLVSRRISVPLEDMKLGAQRFARGDLRGRITSGSSEEIGGLGDALNQMAERLDDRIRTVVRQRNEQEAVLSSMVEGVLAIDNEENVINLNQSAGRLLGVNPESARGRSIQEVVRNPDLQKFVARALASREPVEGEIVLHDGRDYFMQAHGTVLRDEHGQGIGAVIVVNDVTKLRRLENIRRDFVANVSHELKTPITSIKGFVETLQDGALNDPEDAQRFLKIVAKQTDRLSEIIEDLLSLSRIEQESEKGGIHREPARLREILQSAIQVCQVKTAAKSINVILNCPDSLEAKVNPQLLEQAVVNLLDNAFKYSETGKSIEVIGKETKSGVSIGVKDQGCGIAQPHLDRIFERFYRVDKARSRSLGGTGLGLSIVKHIAQAHGGSVGVESQIGQGSTFTIYLPPT